MYAIIEKTVKGEQFISTYGTKCEANDAILRAYEDGGSASAVFTIGRVAANHIDNFFARS